MIHLFVDVDGTLIDEETKTICQRNKEVIKDFISKGHKLSIATGRSVYICDKIIDELDIAHPGHYFVNLNGAVAYDYKYNPLYSSTIKTNRLRDIIQVAIDYKYGINLYTLNGIYLYLPDDVENLLFKNAKNLTLLNKDSLEEFLKEKAGEILKIEFQSSDYQSLIDMYNETKDLFEGLDIAFSSKRYFELTNSGVSKGTAIEYLLKHELEEGTIVATIGDSPNDLTMIQLDVESFAVKNAEDMILKNAKTITKSTAKEGAVAEAIEYLLEKYGDK